LAHLRSRHRERVMAQSQCCLGKLSSRHRLVSAAGSGIRGPAVLRTACRRVV
jgi:hypothetical protein